jgi:hypothetical protein
MFEIEVPLQKPSIADVVGPVPLGPERTATTSQGHPRPIFNREYGTARA